MKEGRKRIKLKNKWFTVVVIGVAVTHMEELRYEYKILVGKLGGKRPYGTLGTNDRTVLKRILNMI
jgi:hypothetical protein